MCQDSMKSHFDYFLNKMQQCYAKIQGNLEGSEGGECKYEVLHSLEVYEALKQRLEPFGAV